MKDNFTSLNVIIDESSSMYQLASDTISGFNKFLEDQKIVPGEVIFTLCKFNTTYSLVHDCVKIASVPSLDNKTYSPKGYTALLDAVGNTIDEVGKKLAAMPEEERPAKVLFLIMTDGEENSSKKYTREKVRQMIIHQREVYNWEFVFMGANIDAVAEGESLGVIRSNSLNYQPSSAGTKALYGNISESTTRYRSSASQVQNFFGNTPVIITPVIPVVDKDKK